jgi:hypothetical protein
MRFKGRLFEMQTDGRVAIVTTFYPLTEDVLDKVRPTWFSSSSMM